MEEAQARGDGLSQLDINTPAGQETLQQEKDAIAIFIRASATERQKRGENPDYFRYIHTIKTRHAAADGLLVDDRDEIRAAVVVSCRVTSRGQRFTQAYFKRELENEWLLTEDKLHKLALLSKLLCCPGFGWLHFVPEKALWVVRMSNMEGEIMATWRAQETRTQATVNGGSVVRPNAFIDMREAKVLT